MPLLRRLARRGTGAPGRLRRDLAVAFCGQLGKSALSWLTFLVLARRWHPDLLGLYGLAEAVYTIAFHLSELGLGTGVTRFAAKGIRKEDEAATAGFLRAVFLAKLATSLAVFALGFLLAPLVARLVLERPEVTPYLRIGLLSIFGMHLSVFYQAYLAARLEFGLNAAFNVLTPLGILLAVSFAWWQDALTVRAALWIYALVPLATCLLASAALPHDFLKSRRSRGDALRKVWRFSRWVYLTSTMGEVRFRLNSVYLSRTGDLRDVGLYNFADKLAATLTLFTSTILTVLVPRVSHLVSHAEIKQVLRKSYLWMAILVPPLALVPLAAAPLIARFIPRYVAAVPMFTLLFVSVLFSLVAMPSRTVLYSTNRPQVETLIEAIALIFTLIGGWWLVRSHGAVGASLAMLVQRLVSAALTVGWVHLRIYRAAAHEVETASLTGVAAD